MSTFGLALSPVAGPVVIPAGASPLVHAIGGTAGGFIVVYTDAVGGHAAFVANDGTLGATQSIGGAPILNGEGDNNAPGAALAPQHASGVDFGYARGALTDPFERTPAIAPASANVNDVANLAGNGSSFRVGWFANNGTYEMGVSAGCH